MFDNLNNEQNSDQKPVKPSKGTPLVGGKKREGIDISGTKEPEDIFSNIQDPVLANSEPVNPAMAVIQKPSSGVVKKIILALIIFIVIFGIGIGSWYAYQYFIVNKKQDISDEITNNQKKGQLPQKISQQESAERPPVKLPIRELDEQAGQEDQLAMNLLKNKADQEESANQATNTESNTTSTDQDLEQQTGEVPENIPLPTTTIKVVIGEDNDNDGLTNFEEKLLGTDPDVKDTDGDGYGDYAELQNGYDPLRVATKLSKSSAVKFAKIGLLKFMMPNAWQLEPGLNGIVKINTGTLISVVVNVSIYSNSQSLQNWLLQQNPSWSATDLISISNDLGLESYYSPDKNKAWILSKNTLYEVSYNLNTSSTDDFRSLFGLLLKHVEEVK